MAKDQDQNKRSGWSTGRVGLVVVALSLTILSLSSSSVLVDSKCNFAFSQSVFQEAIAAVPGASAVTTMLEREGVQSLNSDTSPAVVEHPICTLDESGLDETLVHKHQHGLEGRSCQDMDYMIIEPAVRGFGDMLYAIVSLMTMNFDKANVVIWKWDNGFMRGVRDATQCPNKNAATAWECYFKPVSKCTLQDALDVAGVESITEIPQWQTAPEGARVKKVQGTHLYEKRRIPEYVRNFWPVDMKERFASSDPWKTQLFRYLLQFNPETKAALEPHLRAIRETVKDLDTSRTISLPIRGSDKCAEDVSGIQTFHESDCLPFRAYMDAILDVWELDNRVTDVLVTSEDNRYIEAVKRFAREPPPPGFEDENGNHKFRFRFNELDVHQGSSLMKNIIKAGTLSNHFEIMRSMWTTLELATQARYYVINCYSNFHGMILSYRYSTCKGNGEGAPIAFCVDRKGKMGVKGFNITTIEEGGEYEGRWVYSM